MRTRLPLLVSGLILLGACTGTSVFDLSEGQCFNSASEEIGSSVEIVDCAGPHEYEIYSIFDYQADAGAAYPGDETVSSFADDGCTTDFEAFVGSDYDTSELYAHILRPSEDTWGNGDREIICSLYLPDEQLTGTMRNSNR